MAASGVQRRETRLEKQTVPTAAPAPEAAAAAAAAAAAPGDAHYVEQLVSAAAKIHPEPRRLRPWRSRGWRVRARGSGYDAVQRGAAARLQRPGRGPQVQGEAERKSEYKRKYMGASGTESGSVNGGTSKNSSGEKLHEASPLERGRQMLPQLLLP